MGLRARERRELTVLEAELSCSAPDLAAQMALFARLTTGEAMPSRESVRARERHPGLLFWRLHRRLGLLRSTLGGVLTCLAMLIVLTGGLISAALVGPGPRQGRCGIPRIARVQVACSGLSRSRSGVPGGSRGSVLGQGPVLGSGPVLLRNPASVRRLGAAS